MTTVLIVLAVLVALFFLKLLGGKVILALIARRDAKLGLCEFCHVAKRQYVWNITDHPPLFACHQCLVSKLGQFRCAYAFEKGKLKPV